MQFAGFIIFFFSFFFIPFWKQIENIDKCDIKTKAKMNNKMEMEKVCCEKKADNITTTGNNLRYTQQYIFEPFRLISCYPSSCRKLRHFAVFPFFFHQFSQCVCIHNKMSKNSFVVAYPIIVMSGAPGNGYLSVNVGEIRKHITHVCTLDLVLLLPQRKYEEKKGKKKLEKQT